ncbi:site-specific DNA-methyltransferase [Nitrobacter sp. JJSN]|uniref:site-specific DNA-methyltransferase n=1 Tax=Nitrobacter sp. JJSN TaxID=3453033 RepID=UPI003F77764B
MDVKQVPWSGKNAIVRLPSEQIEYVPASALKPNPRNPRTHSEKQIDQLVRSVLEFGLTLPLLVDGDNTIVKGNAVFAALKQLGVDSIPVLRVDHLSPTQLRAYVIADNRTALNAGWDVEILKEDFEAILDCDLDVTITGFDFAEIDLIVNSDSEAAPDPADELPALPATAVTQLGDIWTVGPHRLICGDATKPETFAALMGNARAQMVFADPPYNVAIDGHVSGLGKNQHREFVQASGEMTRREFVAFLTGALRNLADYSLNGALHYLCMDWRHALEIQEAGEAVYSELKNICVWAKTNAGMGSLYRSQHEFVYVFKVGKSAHINNIQLGRYGRARSNVWTYAGATSFGVTRDADLAMHPTVKPVAMIADAILDASQPKGAVLDCFAGSGSTLVAAAKARRIGYGVELDPIYCDVILTRLARVLKADPVLQQTGKTFTQMAAERSDATAERPEAAGGAQ